MNMDMVGKKLGRYMWDKTWEKPVDGNDTRVMIEKCLDIIDHSSDLAEAQYLSRRCIEKIVGYSTDQPMNKAAQTADRLAASMTSLEAKHANNVAALRALAGSFSGNLPLAALAISAIDSSAMSSTKEVLGRVYLGEMAKSACEPAEKSVIASALALSGTNYPALQSAGYRAALSMLTSPVTVPADQALLQIAKKLEDSATDSTDVRAAGHFLGEFGKLTQDADLKVLAESAGAMVHLTSDKTVRAVMSSALASLSAGSGKPLDRKLMETAEKAFSSTERIQDRGAIAATCIKSLQNISSDPLVKKLGRLISDLEATGSDEAVTLGSTVAFKMLNETPEANKEKIFFDRISEIIKAECKSGAKALVIKACMEAALSEMDDQKAKDVMTNAMALPSGFADESQRIILYLSIVETLYKNREKGRDMSLLDTARNNLAGWDTMTDLNEDLRLNGKLSTARLLTGKILREELSKAQPDPCRKSILSALQTILSQGDTIPVDGSDVIFSEKYMKAAVAASESVFETLSGDVKRTPEETLASIARSILDSTAASCTSGVEAAYAVRPFIEELEKVTTDDTVKTLAQIGREIHEKRIFLYKSEEIVYRALLDSIGAANGSSKDIRLTELAIRCGKDWDNLRIPKDKNSFPYNVKDSSDFSKKDDAVSRGKAEVFNAFIDRIDAVTADPAKKAAITCLQDIVSHEMLMPDSISQSPRIVDYSYTVGTAADKVLPLLSAEYVGEPEYLLVRSCREVLADCTLPAVGKRRITMATPFLRQIHSITGNDAVRNLADVALKIGDMSLDSTTFLKASYTVALNAIERRGADGSDRALAKAAKEAIELVAGDKEHYEQLKGEDRCRIIHWYMTKLRNTTANPDVFKILENMGSLGKIDSNSKEEMNRVFGMIEKLFEAEDLAQSAKDPQHEAEISKDENHIDIGGVKLEIRPDKTMGLLTAFCRTPALQPA